MPTKYPEMKALKLSSVWDWTLSATLYVLFLLLLGKIVDIFSPVTTMFFVLIGTGYGLMSGWLRAIITISGIAMYILSWVALWNWNWSPNEAMLLCGAGILTWIAAVFSPAASHILPLIFAARQRPL